MKTETPADAKLKMMQASTRCIALGLMSLFPVLGACYVPSALWYSWSARRREKFFWNPAQPHRIVGLVSASLGGLFWGGVDTIWIYQHCNPY
jgi:hypothetical protein